jgi:hypothetical protein
MLHTIIIVAFEADFVELAVHQIFFNFENASFLKSTAI